MPSIDVIRQTKIGTSSRVRQLEGMFDVPRSKTETLKWAGDVPLDEKEWNVGLIVGPSGAGKSTVAAELFPDELSAEFAWGGASVLDDFADHLSIQDISESCTAVGFNTIPAWRRPFSVLSTGEKFRVDLARRLVESAEISVVDEFTSVVDRQVAKIGSHAAQKYARKRGGKFVAVTCHYDVSEWLQPDWTLELPQVRFSWHRRRLRCDGTAQRPDIEVSIAAVQYETWKLFAPFHYLTNSLNRSARCFALFVGERIAAFSGVLSFPHPKVKNIRRCSRLVTLPDWQGLGLAFVLSDTLGAAYKRLGYRYRTYPAHPALIRAFDRSKMWGLVKAPGKIFNPAGPLNLGGRPCAVFEYAGEVMPDKSIAKALLMMG